MRKTHFMKIMESLTLLSIVVILLSCGGSGGSSDQTTFTLNVRALSSSQVLLTWNYSAGDETGFRIERSTLEGDFEVIKLLTAGYTSYTDTDLSESSTYTYRVCAYNANVDIKFSNEHSVITLSPSAGTMIIDHSCTVLANIPVDVINQAKATLHIAYGHTSHGEQIMTGMTGLFTWKGSLYEYNAGGSSGALDLRDTPFTGAYDLGNPDRLSWASSTRAYLDAHLEINVVIWCWCGEVSNATEANIDTYLSLMNGLEDDYPGVHFVYMTGHLDGTGLAGNLNQRNEQIRNYCRDNNKILYDFADIESYDPDGNEFLSRFADDGCYYDSNSDGYIDAGNWAIDWQNSHTLNMDWFNCVSAHSQALNANRKAYAAWWLWARLAGWDGQ